MNGGTLSFGEAYLLVCVCLFFVCLAALFLYAALEPTFYHPAHMARERRRRERERARRRANRGRESK